MPLIAETFSSAVRPALRGRFGAVAAAHPLAVAAGQELLTNGGSAADALIAAQAVLCVVMPDACGLGGDMLALVHAPGVDAPGAQPQAVNGTGAAPRNLRRVSDDGAHSITVPGIVDAWCTLSESWGRLPLARALQPAIRLAHAGLRTSDMFAATLAKHRKRLLAGGAERWVLFDAPAGAVIAQPQLAALLERIAADGRAGFYFGAAAQAIAAAIAALGGTLDAADLAAHQTVLAAPIVTRTAPFTLASQPPMTQGVLLNMALQALMQHGRLAAPLDDHAAVELTNAAFAYRDRIVEGAALLERDLPIDLTRASNRPGPRAYLHTAGVACADADGRVISSLVSVFDDFGSCVFVPELGITLNNRAGGFTTGANAAGPGKRPVHTLAPILLQTPQGMLALATPGADGQVQTLLQVVMGLTEEDADLASVIARPRWRSENGELLIERDHGAVAGLRALGHRVVECASGDVRFGAVVSAGFLDETPVAAADWRRETTAGVV
jgi:gamma-glutamyltranspeptidase/glutathione hydrolase